ncbi:MAG: DUF6745 domain-containing protein [Desulfobacterales bacterium]
MAENGIELSYKISKLKKPEIIWCGSPLSLGLTREIILNFKKLKVGDSVGDSVWASVGDSVGASVGASVRASVWPSVWASVRDSVWASVWDSVWARVWASVWASVRASVGDSVGDSVGASVGASVRASVWPSVRASVRDSVRDSVWDSVWASVRDSVRDSVWDSSVYGQHEVHWLGFYDYFNNVLKLELQTEKLAGLWMIAQSAGWFLPHENICWISERHDVCKLKNGIIHCDGGPAIHYPDGFSVWALNGVRVPEYIAITQAEKIDPELIIKEKNAEVRREIVRKIGIERVCQKLSIDTIDTGLDYVNNKCELLKLNIHGDTHKYIKLINPSVPEIYHIEGVPVECENIDQALNSRKPDGLKKIPIDEINGCDWYEQGDVCIWPKNAKSIKSKPLILT